MAVLDYRLLTIYYYKDSIVQKLLHGNRYPCVVIFNYFI